LKLIQNPKEHLVRNMIVAMCREPWKIDRKLGLSGLCYHGNFGESPAGLMAMIDCINRNHNQLKQPGTFY
jgi:hypothetical protein